MSDLPFVRLADIDYLGSLASGKTLRKTGRLDLHHPSLLRNRLRTVAESVVVNELGYLTRPARRALGIGPDFNRAECHCQRIDGEQPADERLAQTEQHLDGFGRLNGSNQP